MSCTEHALVIDHFQLYGIDLPDATALHIDTCPACRARFDARFPRTETSEILPRREGTHHLFAPIAVAAVALLSFLAVPDVPHTPSLVSADYGECIDEIVVDPVCPPV